MSSPSPRFIREPHVLSTVCAAARRFDESNVRLRLTEGLVESADVGDAPGREIANPSHVSQRSQASPNCATTVPQ